MNPFIVGTRIKCIPILLLQLKQTSKFSEGEVFTTFLWKAAFIGSMYWGFKSFLKCSEQWQSSFKRLWWAREFMQYFPPDPQPMYKEFYRFAKLGYFLHIGKDMTFSFASCTQGKVSFEDSWIFQTSTVGLSYCFFSITPVFSEEGFPFR